MIDDSVVIREWYILLFDGPWLPSAKLRLSPLRTLKPRYVTHAYDQYTIFVTSNPALWPHQAAGLHNIFELISEIDAVF